MLGIFYLEKTTILNDVFSGHSKTYVAAKIEELGLNNESKEILKEAISQLLTDSFYTILLGLDGSASIGDNQETYIVIDEDVNTISECGELEIAAYKYFYESKYLEE